MMTRRYLLGGLTASALAWPVRGQAAGTPRIVATTGMIADAARVMTGHPVTALIGPGMDPHSHRPTRANIAALVRADLVLWHGLKLEMPLMSLLSDLANFKPVSAVAEVLPKAELLGMHGLPDPHVWFDPSLWTQVVQGMQPVLEPFGPHVAANAARYLDEIAQITRYAQTALASVPPEARILVTAHDAFAYFGRAFGFEVAGVQGISTESEAGLNRISGLVDLLVSRKIPAVFVESSVSDRALRALIEGAAARGHQVKIGGELFSDAMGPEGSYEGTWVGMFDHNVTTIARALGGQAPLLGANGKLESVK